MNKILQRFGTDYFFTTPAQSKVIFFWLFLYLVILIASIILFFYFRKKGRKETPYKSFAKKILYTEMPISLLGLFFVFARFENLRTFSWRTWQYATFLGFVGLSAWLVWEWRKLKPALIKFHSQLRKEKWLKPAKKGKKR